MFLTLKKSLKNKKISLQIKIRILEAAVMTVVKYGSEYGSPNTALQKEDEDFLDVSQRNFLQNVLVCRDD